MFEISVSLPHIPYHPFTLKLVSASEIEALGSLTRDTVLRSLEKRQLSLRLKSQYLAPFRFSQKEARGAHNHDPFSRTSGAVLSREVTVSRIRPEW